MPSPTTVRVADLLIDEANPRLPTPNRGQREAFRTIAQDQDRKLLKLAQDIVEYGINPAELFIVTATKEEPPRYTVLEGNRRICALKALEAPDILSGAVSPTTLSGLKKLSVSYLENQIETVPCIPFKTRRDAQHWLALKHTGENDGAGVVQWNADETARFRGMERGSMEPFRQALDFAQGVGRLSADVRSRLHTSTFKRLIDTPAVREKLGVTYRSGQLQIAADRDQVARAIAWVAKDIVDREVSVGEVYNIKQRQSYARKIPANVAVRPKGAGVPISALPDKATTKTRRTRRKPIRDILIPYDCALTVHDLRSRDIEHELRKMSLQEFPNGVSVLFRVFIELSVDWYIQDQGIAGVTGGKLGERVRAAGEHLLKRRKLTNAQVRPVRQAAQKGSYLGPTVTLFNDYVHNAAMFPAPADLRSYWNSLQPFLQAIWSP